MTILHAGSEPKFTEHLRRVLGEANGTPLSVDVAIGYFFMSGFAQVANPLAMRPCQAHTSSTLQERE